MPEGQPLTLTRLIRAAGLRWPVEEDFEFGKDCFGLDQSQVRLYTAIARHTVLVMAALAICAVTAALLSDRTDTQAPPPVRPGQPPPADPGMIPLTVPEIARLLAATPGPPARPRRALARLAAPPPSPRPLVPPAHTTHPRRRDCPGSIPLLTVNGLCRAVPAIIALTDINLIDIRTYMSADLEPVPSSAAPVIVVGGGQSGLAAARALRELRMPAVILEASDRPTGSWPRYYDSLRLFSPAQYSSMPGMPFPGAPDRYPGRDEVAGYLERYAARLDVEIQTSTRVQTIRQDGREFIVVTEGGRALRASGIVAASGSFSNPYRPGFPGQEAFTGELSHVADYRNPAAYAGQRVIVVGAGDSAAQVANELAPVATVTLATPPSRAVHPPAAGRPGHPLLAARDRL